MPLSVPPAFVSTRLGMLQFRVNELFVRLSEQFSNKETECES